MSAIQAQYIKFMTVGIISNVVLYLLYILITSQSVGHKGAMTIVYILGVVQTYLFNKRWTFNHKSSNSYTSLKYLSVYGAGYLLNLLILIIFVDTFFLSHIVVQGFAIIVVAIFSFFSQKKWVFY